ncbi:MAG: glycosyltransferase [Gemmatimonadales bacterium]|nr:glycosyltransferase [Gemmatimonadales bacterium]
MRAVLVSADAARPGGRAPLAALAALGHEVTVAVPERWRDATGREHRVTRERDGALAIHPIPVSGDLAAPEALGWSGSALRKLLADVSPHVVDSTLPPWAPGSAAAARAARKGKRPFVAALTAAVAPSLGWSARRREADVLAIAAGVTAHNSLALQRAPSRCGTLPHAIVPRVPIDAPVSAPARRPDGMPFTVGFIGRLVPERGLDVLLRALALLTGDWWLQVTGNGPEREPLEALASRLGLAGRTEWHDGWPSPSIDGHWDAYDVVAVPSRATPAWADGDAAVALRAMAHALPVVVAGTGALGEMVGDAGLVVPEGDVEATAEALHRLRESAAERRAFGQAGRQRVLAQFSADALARRRAEVWDRVRVGL